MEYIENLKMEVVYLNKYYNVPSLSNYFDNRKAAQMMMDYLIGLNHKKILYLTQDVDINVTTERCKMEEYEESMKEINEEPIILKIDMPMKEPIVMVRKY